MPHDPEVLHVGICDCDVPGRADARTSETVLQERVAVLESEVTRLREQRDRGWGRYYATMAQELEDDRQRLDAENARLRAEVERLGRDVKFLERWHLDAMKEAMDDARDYVSGMQQTHDMEVTQLRSRVGVLESAIRNYYTAVDTGDPVFDLEEFLRYWAYRNERGGLG